MISIERPELRIVEAGLWDAVQSRLAAVKRKYKGTATGDEARRVRTHPARYLLSGLLVCDDCGAPMTVIGSARTYYRCSDNRNKGTCANARTIREEDARRRVLCAIRKCLTSPEDIAYVRRRVAEELGDYARKIEAELKERGERLARTEDRIQGLVTFIADGDRSTYVVETLRDLEAQARSEKAAIARLRDESSQPLRLPSIEEIQRVVLNLEERLMQDVDSGRAQLRRWLAGEELRVRVDEAGDWTVRGELLPLAILEEGGRQLGADSMEGAELSNLCSGGAIGRRNNLILFNFSKVLRLFVTE